MLPKFTAVIALCALLCSPAAGFDTFWHETAGKRVGAEFGFSDDAINVMQLGNFSADFFGPVAEYASSSFAKGLAHQIPATAAIGPQALNRIGSNTLNAPQRRKERQEEKPIIFFALFAPLRSL